MASMLFVGLQPTYSNPLRTTLAANHHEVLLVKTVQEAIAQIESRRPDLILLNLDLSGMSGMEPLVELRPSAVEIPILLLVGGGTIESENQARELGAVEFLRKGLKSNLIVDAINRTLTPHPKSPSPRPVPERPADSPADAEPVLVLVVDDEPANRELAKKFLVQKGYQVEMAASGKEALAAIERHQPDLVLLDLYMPGMNGVEVLRHLNDPAFPVKPPPGVIVATASVDEPLLKQCLALGASEVVLKPLDLKHLELAITVQLVMGAQD